MTPFFEGQDFFGCPSEDKFIMTTERDEQFSSSLLAPEKSILFRAAHSSGESLIEVTDQSYRVDRYKQLEGGFEGSISFCKCCVANGEFYCQESAAVCCYLNPSFNETDSNDFGLKVVKDIPANCDLAPRRDYSTASNFVEGFENHNYSQNKALEKSSILAAADSYKVGSHEEVEEEAQGSESVENGNRAAADEFPMYNMNNDEFEVFDLRIIHRKNRLVGFFC